MIKNFKKIKKLLTEKEQKFILSMKKKDKNGNEVYEEPNWEEYL